MKSILFLTLLTSASITAAAPASAANWTRPGHTGIEPARHSANIQTEAIFETEGKSECIMDGGMFLPSEVSC